MLILYKKRGLFPQFKASYSVHHYIGNVMTKSNGRQFSLAILYQIKGMNLRDMNIRDVNARNLEKIGDLNLYVPW